MLTGQFVRTQYTKQSMCVLALTFMQLQNGLVWAFFCNYNDSVNKIIWTHKYVAAYCNLFRETTAIYW